MSNGCFSLRARGRCERWSTYRRPVDSHRHLTACGLRVAVVAFFLGLMSTAFGQTNPDTWPGCLGRGDPAAQLPCEGAFDPGTVDWDTAIPQLLELLSRPEGRVRDAAAMALSESPVQHQRIAEQLVAVVVRSRDENAPVLFALARQGKVALPSILQALRRPAAEVSSHRKDELIVALMEMDPGRMADILQAFLAGYPLPDGKTGVLVVGLARTHPRAFLSAAASDPDFPSAFDLILSAVPDVDRFALFELFQQGPDALKAPAARVLARLYFREHPTDRQEAQVAPEEALFLESPSVLVPVLRAVIDGRSEDWQLRAKSLETLALRVQGQWGPVLARYCANILDDASNPWPVRKAAATALGRFPSFDKAGAESIAALVQVMSNKEEPWPLRVGALDAITGGGQKTLASLSDILADDEAEYTLRHASAVKLAALDNGYATLVRLTGSSSWRTRFFAALGLARVKVELVRDPQYVWVAAEPLRRLQKDPEELVRLSATYALGYARGGGGTDTVSQASVALASNAYRPVPSEKSSRPTVPFSELESDFARLGPTRVTEQFVVDLGKYGGQAVPILVTLIQPEQRHRFLAAEVLGQMGSSAKAATPALCQALKEHEIVEDDWGPPRGPLSDIAAAALMQIGGADGACQFQAMVVLKAKIVKERISADRKLLIVDPHFVNPAAPPIVVPDDVQDLRDFINQGMVSSPRPPPPRGSSGTSALLPQLVAPRPTIWDTVGLTVRSDATVGDVVTRLVSALKRFGTLGFFQVEGGIAMVTRREQISADGSPIAEVEFSLDRPRPSGVREFFLDLVFAPPGHFQTLVFLITSEGSPEFAHEIWNAEQSWSKFNDGAHILPDKVASEPWQSTRKDGKVQHYLHVLVYQFDKPLKGLPRFVSAGGPDLLPDVKTRLEKLGILRELN